MSFSRTDAPADPTQHPAMRRFAAAVRALYGDRVERIVLFGSRARGDAREDSDWDVAVFLRDFDRAHIGSDELAEITNEILLGTGADINPVTLRAEAYDHRTAFMRELRREGIDLISRAGNGGRDARVKPGHDDFATNQLLSLSLGSTRRSPGEVPNAASPEAADLLKRSTSCLGAASEILIKTDLHAVAARQAYNAVLQAARAVLLDRTDRVVTKHRPVRDEIGRLADRDPVIGLEFAAFLAQWFEAAILADYLVEREHEVEREMAERALATATRLVAHAEWLLAQPDAPPAA